MTERTTAKRRQLVEVQAKASDAIKLAIEVAEWEGKATVAKKQVNLWL